MAQVILPIGYQLVVHKWSMTGLANELSISFGCKTDPLMDNLQLAQLAHEAISSSGAISSTTFMLASYTLESTLAYAMTSGGLTGAQYNDAIQGTVGVTNAVPVALSLVIQKKTGFLGKRQSGRLYMPPICATEADIGATGEWSSSSRLTYQTAIEDWITELTAGGFVEPMLLHTHPDDEPTPIVDWNLVLPAGIQRRRFQR